MARATYTLLVDWNNDGDWDDANEDVSDDVLSLDLERGRDHASMLVGRSIASKLVVRLKNLDGVYSSFNAASPIYGNILPGRKVRLQWDSGSFPYTFPFVFSGTIAWTGYLQRIVPVPDVHGRNIAVLEAIGPLGWLNQARVRLAHQTSVLTDAAIDAILDAAGWAAGDRDLDTGLTTLTRFWQDEAFTLHALRKVEETEAGFIYETRDGKIGFANRHARYLDSRSITSQATFSDAAGATLTYQAIEQEDPLPNVFNKFEPTVQLYTVGNLATLWTLAETGASSPVIAPGETRTFWARYPNPVSASDAVAVDAWTTPVVTTDYTANSASDGSGTDLASDLSVTVTKFAQAMKIAITNDHATLPAYLTLLQARGTPITADDPVQVLVEDSTSQTTYGERRYPDPPEFIPDTAEAHDWANYHLQIVKDAQPTLSVTIAAHRDQEHQVQALTRDLSDRVTLVATNDAGLGINEDFFIESERHRVDSQGRHLVTWQLSPIAGGYGEYWVLDTSELGTTTRLAY